MAIDEETLRELLAAGEALVGDARVSPTLGRWTVGDDVLWRLFRALPRAGAWQDEADEGASGT